MNWLLIPWVIASTVLLLVVAYWIYTVEQREKALEARYQKILALAEETDQATIVQLLARLEARESQVTEMEAALSRLMQALPHTIQGYGVVRYDAFENVAGDQSFSLALVDQSGSGVMLSGLHSRADTRVYAKSLKQWQAGYGFSAEEQQALGLARQVLEGKGAPSDS